MSVISTRADIYRSFVMFQTSFLGSFFFFFFVPQAYFHALLFLFVSSEAAVMKLRKTLPPE